MLGLDNLISNQKKYSWLKNINLALISNNVNIPNHQNNRNIDLLLHNNFKIKKIFTPTKNENVKFRKKQTMITADSGKTKLSVYLWNITKTSIPQKELSEIDALIFDMTDSGLRHDICFASLERVLQTTLQFNKKLIVLDRPNPLGSNMEGPGEIPLRTGMTVGELAYYLNRYSEYEESNLIVIPMVNWKRNKPLADIKENFLSLNITGLNTCYAFSFLSLLQQIKPIDVGVNTEYAWQALLLPENKHLSKWEMDYLKTICSKLGIYCKNYAYWDHEKKTKLYGIQLRVKKDINNFSSFNTLLTLARFLNNRKHIKLSYSNLFDTTLGSPDTKLFLQGILTFDELKKGIENSVKNFYTKSKNCLLYKPYPKINNVELIKG